MSQRPQGHTSIRTNVALTFANVENGRLSKKERRNRNHPSFNSFIPLVIVLFESVIVNDQRLCFSFFSNTFSNNYRQGVYHLGAEQQRTHEAVANSRRQGSSPSAVAQPHRPGTGRQLVVRLVVDIASLVQRHDQSRQ